MKKSVSKILQEAYKEKDWQKVLVAYESLSGKKMQSPVKLTIDYDWRESEYNSKK